MVTFVALAPSTKLRRVSAAVRRWSFLEYKGLTPGL